MTSNTKIAIVWPAAKIKSYFEEYVKGALGVNG